MSSLKQKYILWISKNHRWVIPFVDMARQLTLFLPGRYGESELRSEFLYSSLNLIQLINQNSLKGVVAPSRSVYSCDYKCGEETPNVRVAKDIISFFHYTEVFLEMLAEKRLTTARDQSGKLKVIVFIELIKTLARLYLLNNNKGKMLRSFSPEESQFHVFEEKSRETARRLEEIEPEHRHEFFSLANLYLSHGRGETIHGRFVGPPVHSRESDYYCPPNSEILSEVLYWSRPVIYACARLRYGEKSWYPLYISFAIDVIARLLQARYNELSDQQKAEYNRRNLYYIFYLFRSPLFDEYTKWPILRLVGILTRIPIIGFIIGNIVEVFMALQKRYFYTSAS